WRTPSRRRSEVCTTGEFGPKRFNGRCAQSERFVGAGFKTPPTSPKRMRRFARCIAGMMRADVAGIFRAIAGDPYRTSLFVHPGGGLLRARPMWHRVVHTEKHRQYQHILIRDGKVEMSRDDQCGPSKGKRRVQQPLSLEPKQGDHQQPHETDPWPHRPRKDSPQFIPHLMPPWTSPSIAL